MEENKVPESDLEKKIDQADGIITKAWNLLMCHWGKLIIFVLLYGGYQFCILVGKELDKPAVQTEQVDSEVFVVREYREYYEDGTTAMIQVWSDSTETFKSPAKN